jgi:hypothetical protein
MGDAGADHDPIGRAAYAPGPGQVVGQGVPEFGTTPRVTRAEGVVGRGGEGTAAGGERGGAGKGGGVRLALPQVVFRGGRALRNPLRHPRGSGWFGTPGNAGAGGLAGGQPALGDQFGVGVGDGVAGEAEVGGE